jgi:DNA topoisomerase-3
MDDDAFSAALDKLWVHGGADVDPEENVKRGTTGWRASYEAQREHRKAQLERMSRFAAMPACRMLQLVRHFGDREDSGRPCGQCDFCDPGARVLQNDRAPSASELEQLKSILRALAVGGSVAAGKLYRDLFEGATDRKRFEALLEGLARTGLVDLTHDSFRKDGRVVDFRRATLTAEGRRNLASEGGPVNVRIVGSGPKTATPKRERKALPKPASRKSIRAPKEETWTQDTADSATLDALRLWRLEEARRRRIPAFRILTDRVLFAIAAARPTTDEQLLAIPGFGPALLKRYGGELLALVGTR